MSAQGKPKTVDEVTEAAWALANAMTNHVVPAIRGRDELIREMLRDHRTDSWLGDDYYAEQAKRLGIEVPA